VTCDWQCICRKLRWRCYYSNVELGASVLRHVVVSTRYDAVRKIDGVSLSGFSGRVAVKVF